MPPRHVSSHSLRPITLPLSLLARYQSLTLSRPLSHTHKRLSPRPLDRYRQHALRSLVSRVRYTLFGDIFGDLDAELDRRARSEQRAQRAQARAEDGAAAAADGDGDDENEDEDEDEMYDDVPHLVVSVADSGAGIAKEDIPKNFRSIVQFNPNELQGGGGSGLGMVLSRGIVVRHGGQVWLHSEGVGHGRTCI